MSCSCAADHATSIPGRISWATGAKYWELWIIFDSSETRVESPKDGFWVSGNPHKVAAINIRRDIWKGRQASQSQLENSAKPSGWTPLLPEEPQTAPAKQRGISFLNHLSSMLKLWFSKCHTQWPLSFWGRHVTPYILLPLPLQVRSKLRMSPSCHSQNPGGPLTDMGWEMLSFLKLTLSDLSQSLLAWTERCRALSCRGHREVESVEGLRIPDCGQGAAFLGCPCPAFTFSMDHGCLENCILHFLSYNSLFFFLAVLDLHCRTQAVSSWGERRLLSSWGMQASHWGARALAHAGFSISNTRA